MTDPYEQVLNWEINCFNVIEGIVKGYLHTDFRLRTVQKQFVENFNSSLVEGVSIVGLINVSILVQK
jgi:hypothetical protein